MIDERLTWLDVRPELYGEYEAHDGYLPHHAEREWAPRMGIKPNSLRTRFTNDLGHVCDELWDYGLAADDLALIKGIRPAFAAYERLRSAGRPVPPFPAFLGALWSTVEPDMFGVQEAMNRCAKCQRDRHLLMAARLSLPDLSLPDLGGRPAIHLGRISLRSIPVISCQTTLLRTVYSVIA